MSSSVIKSISFDEQEIIRNIIKLHCQSHIQLDPTFSTGNFYKHGLQTPDYIFDINPLCDNVKYSDVRSLPIDSGVIQTAIFDPPFLATTGKSILVSNNSNSMVKRFGCYKNEKDLHRFYIDSMIELHRVISDDGILIFKCQDKVSSGNQYMSHVFIINEAEKIGFYCKDLFILLSKNRMTPKWQVDGQKNARKFHSYFLVLKKTNKKTKYI